MFSGKRQGLASDIRKYLSQSNLFMNLEIAPEMDEYVENLVLEPETELQLLRIMQEAISNVHKHSQAQKARVMLTYLGTNTLRLSISDNGIGFDSAAIIDKGQPHFGLATMQERAESIGAVFEVKSSPEDGTLITVTLKLPEKDR